MNEWDTDMQMDGQISGIQGFEGLGQDCILFPSQLFFPSLLFPSINLIQSVRPEKYEKLMVESGIEEDFSRSQKKN